MLLLNNRQQRYRLRRSAAPRTQPARNILPVTLRVGEKQVQLEERPEDGDEWIRLSRTRREGLGQRLARGLATGTDVDATSGTEYNEWVAPARFRKTIAPFASDKNEATKDAEWHTDGPEEQFY